MRSIREKAAVLLGLNRWNGYGIDYGIKEYAIKFWTACPCTRTGSPELNTEWKENSGKFFSFLFFLTTTWTCCPGMFFSWTACPLRTMNK
jgi:hypothetical protein